MGARTEPTIPMTRTPVFTVAVASAACSLVLAAGAVCAQGGFSVQGGVSRPSAALSVKAAGPWAHSPWVKGHNSAVRLVGGAEPYGNAGRRLLLGVEITLAEGWKTYWRSPGDDGGLPPSFNWAQSRNLRSAVVLYPVPERIKSLGGTTIGYSRSVVFPVEIEANDPARAVEVVAVLEYGICRDICVPSEAKLSLAIEPSLAAMPPDLAAALKKVPTKVAAAETGSVLKAAGAVLAGKSPALTFDIIAAAVGGKPELFVEAPSEFMLPAAVKADEGSGGAVRFRLDLKGVDNAAALAGKTLRLTVAGTGGARELDWVVK